MKQWVCFYAKDQYGALRLGVGPVSPIPKSYHHSLRLDATNPTAHCFVLLHFLFVRHSKIALNDFHHTEPGHEQKNWRG